MEDRLDMTQQRTLTKSPESQICPGLHQKHLGHQGERPPGMVHPALGSPEQKQHRPVGASPEQAMKMIRGMKHLSCRERLRQLEFFSLETEGFRFTLMQPSSIWRDAIRKRERDYLQGPVVTVQRETILN